MTKVNMLFEGIFGDVDIIAMPVEIVSRIEAIGQAFIDWVPDVQK